MGIPTNMYELPPEIVGAVNGIVDSINVGQCVIFCGAGISRDAGFPVVNELVPYLLIMLCSTRDEIRAIEDDLKGISDLAERNSKLRQTIKQRLEAPAEAIDSILDRLPFEAFVESLRHNSSIRELLEIYDADAYSPSVEPNTNHVLLAKLVATGKVKTVVTTNFDQLIEKALKDEGKQGGDDYDIIYREADFAKIDWEQDRCRLIKIHGSIDDSADMAITLSQVAKRELTAARAGIIRQIFRDGKHSRVLILGYSCSDLFDLSPQIEALKINRLKKVFLVQHADIPRVEDIRLQIGKNPFKSFADSTRLFFNTNRLVELVWKTAIKDPDPRTGADGLKPSPDWKGKVHCWYTDSVEKFSEGIKDAIPALLFLAVAMWRPAIARYERLLAFAKKHGYDQIQVLALHNMGEAHHSLGDYREAMNFFGQALELARRKGMIFDEGNVLGSLGNVYANRGDYKRAIEFLDQQLTIVRGSVDYTGQSGCLVNLGVVYNSLGQYDRAIELSYQALDIALRIGNVRCEGTALGNIANAYVEMAQYGKAAPLYEKVLEIAQNTANLVSEEGSQNNLGSVYCSLGQFRKAIEYGNGALEIARRIGDKQGEINALGNLANVHRELGEYQMVIDVFAKQQLEVARSIGYAEGECSALNNMGSSYMQLGVLGKAAELYEECRGIAHRIGYAAGETNYLCNLGTVALNLGRCTEAIGFFEESLVIARRIKHVRGEGNALGGIGCTYLQLEQYGTAIGFFEQALGVMCSIKNIQSEGQILANLGAAYAGNGDKEKAMRSLARSKAIFTKLGLSRSVKQVEEMIVQADQ